MKNIIFALLAGTIASTSFIGVASADCDESQLEETDFSGYEHEDDGDDE